MSEQRKLLRRGFVAQTSVAAVLIACGDTESNESTSGASGGSPSTGPGGAGGQGGASGGQGGIGANGAAGPGGTGPGGQGGAGGMGGTPACGDATKDDIEGPFYKSDAPLKEDLAEPGMEGVELTVSGRVTNEACEPLADVEIDIWQADDEGAYDAVGFVLRGKVLTDDQGLYSFHSIIPGHYLNGAQFRPAHIHVKVRAQGFAELTTQLYFEGDPYNDIDPWFDPALMMSLVDDGANAKSATFDFVLV